MNGAAIQVASREFDRVFFALAPALREHIQRKIDAMGLRLSTFSHFRMQGSNQFRLRIGDYRVIYQFDLRKNQIYLITMGHRREIYRA